ncbi:MAG: S9 family peptidase [Gammaproteobacteria bacterium]|nr:MAG: S9 family peptidase [Gammaproteobacteria bacterium]
MKGFTKLGLVVVFAFMGQFIFAKASDIPVKDFFRNAEFSGMQISPDGKHIAVLSPVNNTRNIVVMDTEGLKNFRTVTRYKDQDIAGFFWANNDDIVFTMDSDGNEAFSLFKVDTSSKKNKIVTLVGSQSGSSGIRSASVIHVLPEDPDHLIVQYNGRRVKSPDLYKLPLDSSWNRSKKKNKRMKLIAKNPGDVQSWIVDHDGEVRGAFSLLGLKGKFHYKSKGAEDFSVIQEFNLLDEGLNPLAFDFDNKTMFVSSNVGRDRGAIYKFDPETNKLGEMIFEHDVVDVSGLIMSRKQQKLLGITYMDDYPERVYFDKKAKNMMEGLSNAFPGKRVAITSNSKDEMLNIVLVNNDNDPGKYYLYDRNKNKLSPLLPRMEWLKPADLSPMKPIKFVSRDGLNIHGYITIPKDSDGKNLPLIINPHGGPFGVRDSWGFNPEHQFFASRGYATVQVNYRGSGGYGRKFEHAGYDGKWGAEMQNDLTDAVKYLIKEGIANPDKVCIYGASYGGYATMAGLAFTPELYKCGINYVGVTDVGLLFSSMPKHWEPAKELMKVQIGDPDDKELMKRMSPLAHVDNIKAPLMIIQGAKDPRVVKQHATDLRDELEDRGIELSDDEWIMKLDEGHGFRKEENRIELYTKMEKFLAKHLD